VTRPLSDLVAIAEALPKELQQAQVKGVQKAALFTTRSIRDQIRSATGGDMRMSGVGKRGTKLNAYYDVKGRVNPTALIKARGPLQLLERDTSPHEIRPRKRRKAKGQSGRKALRLSDGNFRGTVRHPGTRGKHPWAKGVAKSRGKTEQIFEDEIHKAIVRAVR
jgi:hypothetical protein